MHTPSNTIRRAIAKIPALATKKKVSKAFTTRLCKATDKPVYDAIAHPANGKEIKSGRADTVIPVTETWGYIKGQTANGVVSYKWLCSFAQRPNTTSSGVVAAESAKKFGIYEYLVFDIEIPKSEGGHNAVMPKEDALALATETLNELGLWGYTRSLVYTGGGIHAYIKLQDALNYDGFLLLTAITKANLEVLENHGAAYTKNIDTSMLHPIRLARAPFSLNYKYGAPVKTEVVYKADSKALDGIGVIMSTLNAVLQAGVTTAAKAKAVGSHSLGTTRAIDTIKANIRVIDLVGRLPGLGDPVYTSLFRDQYHNPITGGDHNPSFAVYHNADHDRWVAFNDGNRTGDVIDLVSILLDIDTKAAIKWFIKEFNMDIKTDSTMTKEDLDDLLAGVFGTINDRPVIGIDNITTFYDEDDLKHTVLYVKLTFVSGAGIKETAIIDAKKWIRRSFLYDFVVDYELFTADPDSEFTKKNWSKIAMAVLQAAPRENDKARAMSEFHQEIMDYIVDQACGNFVFTAAGEVHSLNIMKPVFALVSLKTGIESAKLVIRGNFFKKMLTEYLAINTDRASRRDIYHSLGFQYKQTRIGDFRVKAWVLPFSMLPNEYRPKFMRSLYQQLNTADLKSNIEIAKHVNTMLSALEEELGIQPQNSKAGDIIEMSSLESDTNILSMPNEIDLDNTQDTNYNSYGPEPGSDDDIPF